MTYRRFHHSRCSKVVTNVLPVIHMSGSHLPMTLGLLLPRGKAHVAGRSLAPAPSFVTPSTHHRPCRSIPPLAHCRLLKPLGASLPCARRRAHPARALPPPQHTHTHASSTGGSPAPRGHLRPWEDAPKRPSRNYVFFIQFVSLWKTYWWVQQCLCAIPVQHGTLSQLNQGAKPPQEVS